MIKAILVFNNHGKARITKFYAHYSEQDQQLILRETYQLVSKRDENVCNFLEGGSLIEDNSHDYRLIYRHYATLYFVFCVDAAESELGILDLIQVFVEALNKCFENVCELDFVFHADKVHHILNEAVLGGLVLETSVPEITARYDEQAKLVHNETGLPGGAHKAAASALRDLHHNMELKRQNIRLPPSIAHSMAAVVAGASAVIPHSISSRFSGGNSTSSNFTSGNAQFNASSPDDKDHLQLHH